MIKKVISSAGIIAAMIALSSPVFAHSMVKPDTVGVAAFQDFTVSVPSEKAASTISVNLTLPAGISFVTPVVKSGWKVEVKSGPIPDGMAPPVATDGDIATTIPTEIDWTGGSIPAEQKDNFVFSAQVPAQPAELDWKITQGYSDGSTVSWNLGPNDSQPKDDKGSSDFSSQGPFTKTMVVNDLKNAQPTTSTLEKEDAPGSTKIALVLSGLAILAAGGSLWMQFKKKGK